MGDQLSSNFRPSGSRTRSRGAATYAAKLFETDESSENKRPPRREAAAAAARAADGRDADGASAVTAEEAEAVAGAKVNGLFVSGWDGGIPSVMPSKMMQSKRMPPAMSAVYYHDPIRYRPTRDSFHESVCRASRR